LDLARSKSLSPGLKRPKHIKPPAHVSDSPPVPPAEAALDAAPPSGEETRLDPTRYGDWEKKGIAIDF
jgi:hypothetical protein